MQGRQHDEPDGETTMPRGKAHADMTTAHLLEHRSTLEDEDVDALEAVRTHRPAVVRRLLDRGLSPAALDRILPGWSELADD